MPLAPFVRETDRLRKRLKRLHDTDGLTWRAIAQNYPGVAPSTLHGIAHGLNPARPELLHKLGFSRAKPQPLDYDAWRGQPEVREAVEALLLEVL